MRRGCHFSVHSGRSLPRRTLNNTRRSLHLIEKVVVTPGPGRPFEVELEGEIAAMVARAQGQETTRPPPLDRPFPKVDRHSVKVLARARNHRQVTLSA
jgi:hypothetical protein